MNLTLQLEMECCKPHPCNSLTSPELGQCTACVCHQNHLLGMKSLLMAMVEHHLLGLKSLLLPMLERVPNMGMEILKYLLGMPMKVAPPQLGMDQVGLRSTLRHGLDLCHHLKLCSENALDSY